MLLDKIFVKEPSATEKEIERVCEDRAYYDPTSDEYAVLNARLKELMELREMEKKPKFQVSGDTIVKGAIMTGVCVLIVFKEELVGPVVSKALSIVTKLA